MRNSWDVFGEARAIALVKTTQLYIHSRMAPPELLRLRRRHRQMFSDHAAVTRGEQPRTWPPNPLALWDLCLWFQRANHDTAPTEVAARIREIKGWNMQSTPDIESALQQRRLGSRGQKGRRRVLRTALSQYFQRTAGIEPREMSVLKTRMQGAYFSYRMKDEHNVLKSLFYMPGPHGLAPREGWADVRLPIFLHWLYDKSGQARHVRGHVLPLEGDVVMIGFVKSMQNEKGYSGVKILTFKPQEGDHPYNRIDAAFLSRYDDRNPDRHYDAGRSVTIRVNPEIEAVIAGKVADFLRDMRKRDVLLSDAIVRNLKDYIGEICLPDALKDMKLTEDEFRKAVAIRSMEGADVDGMALMGPIDLGH